MDEKPNAEGGKKLPDAETEATQEKPSKSKLDQVVDFLDRNRWILVRVAIVAGLLGLAAAALFGEEKAEDILALGVLLAIGLMAVAVKGSDLVRVFGRVSKFSFGPVAIDVLADTKVAARLVTDAEDEDPNADKEAPESLLELRFRLESKLAYIAKHILDSKGEATFVTIGSLKVDRLISRDEAKVAVNVLTLREAELGEVPDAERKAFLEEADKVVGRIRASVLNAQVRKWLESQRPEREVKELPRGGRLRPEMMATRNGRTFRVTAVVADSEDPDVLNKAKKRMSPDKETWPGIDQRVVVIPHVSRAPEELAADPAVVKNDNLEAVFK